MANGYQIGRAFLKTVNVFLIVGGVALVGWAWWFMDAVRSHDARSASAVYPYCFEQKSDVCFYMTTAERDHWIIAMGIYAVLVLISLVVWHIENRKKKYNG